MYDKSEIIAIKDAEKEYPIPSAWRPTIRAICHAFTLHDYQLQAGVTGVAPIAADTATQIKKYIQQYGATLTELSDTTWRSSVCIWNDTHWDALIDLWTISEGRSDLVLRLHVVEAGKGFLIHVVMVYVP